MIVLLVMTDGRDELLAHALGSAAEYLSGRVTRIVVHDDTGDNRHRAKLAAIIEGHGKHVPAEVIGADERLGFGGAIENAWAHLRRTAELDQCRFVFHLEDDFMFTRDVDLEAMSALLDESPGVAQVALRRQAWNSDELAAGGVVELHPDWYHDEGDEIRPWLAHRVCFTTNPCLYRRSLTWSTWPAVPHSEGLFTHELLAEGFEFAYWGARADGPWVEHLGQLRTGAGY